MHIVEEKNQSSQARHLLKEAGQLAFHPLLRFRFGLGITRILLRGKVRHLCEPAGRMLLHEMADGAARVALNQHVERFYEGEVDLVSGLPVVAQPAPDPAWR